MNGLDINTPSEPPVSPKVSQPTIDIQPTNGITMMETPPETPPATSRPHKPHATTHQRRHNLREDDDDKKSFPRLSKPVELMRNSYDCVVIGSGYGGGVAASRMARAGLGVCLLERGHER
jgi:hypothetical protein